MIVESIGFYDVLGHPATPREYADTANYAAVISSG